MFEAARLKVKRADKHISEFTEMIGDFIHSDFCTIGIKKDTQTGNNLLQMKMVRDVPCDIPLVLGDAIHNLRAALDIAYVELVTAAGCEPTKWTTFRVFDDKDKLIATLSKGVLQGAPDIVSMLADDVRAYEGGDPLLCALNNLDISDKHILLIPTFHVLKLENVTADVVVGNSRLSFRGCSFGVSNSGELNIISSPMQGGDIQINGYGQPTFTVLFGDGTPLEGEPIIPTLTQLMQLVSGILDAFEQAITARDSSGPH